MNWGIHPFFPDYKVSENCDVIRITDGHRGTKAGDIIRGRVLTSGYRQFKLVNKDGFRSFIRANRLIAEIFIGPPPTPLHHAAHKDGMRTNNKISNIRWATPKENARDKNLHGTAICGVAVNNAILTDEIVRQMRAEYKGPRYGEIRRLARKFGYRESHIWKVVHGEIWQHVSEEKRCRPTT